MLEQWRVISVTVHRNNSGIERSFPGDIGVMAAWWGPQSIADWEIVPTLPQCGLALLLASLSLASLVKDTERGYLNCFWKHSSCFLLPANQTQTKIASEICLELSAELCLLLRMADYMLSIWPCSSFFFNYLQETDQISSLSILEFGQDNRRARHCQGKYVWR